MSFQRLIQVAAVGLVCGATYLVFEFSEPADARETNETESVEVKSEEKPTTPTKSLTGDAAKTPAKKKQKKLPLTATFALPNGERMPVLNGAHGAPAMSWPPNRPWSPIINKVTDPDGIEWYWHEDGSRTTTQNLFHTHLGRKAPVTNVFVPQKTVPMDPTEISRIKESQERAKQLKKAKK